MALSRPPLLAVAPIVTLPWTSLPAELRDLTAFASPLNISFPTPAARVSSSYLLLLSLLLCSFFPSWLPLPRRAQPTSPVLPPPPRTRLHLDLDICLCPRSRCMFWFCGKHRMLDNTFHLENSSNNLRWGRASSSQRTID